MQRVKPPLLFIEEKSPYPTEVEAQSFYYSKKAKQKEPTEDHAPTEELQQQTTKQSNKEKSSFESFDLSEKFKHLNRLLLTIPQMNCEIVTEEKSFKGTIQDISEDSIVLKPQQAPAFKISRKIIRDIHLVGL